MKRLARWWYVVGLLAVSVAFLVGAVTAYRDARLTVRESRDQILRALLLSLRSGPLEPRRIQSLLAESLGVGREDVNYAVVDENGNVIAGDRGLTFPWPNAENPLRFRNIYHQSRAMRVAAMRLADQTMEGREGVTLVLAESLAMRNTRAWSLFWRETSRQSWLFLLGLVIIWLGRRAARSDGKRLADALNQRRAEDLTPLDVDQPPAELEPLIGAINLHLARLAGLLEASRGFAADVAHQLRTPLTLLGAQAQYGLRQADPVKLRETVAGIVEAARGAQRLCNQMLSLSRVEAAKGSIRDGVHVDLGALLRETALDLSLLALEKHIDLAFDDAGETIVVVGNEIMLHELFANLIDNALRYTPSQGWVRLKLGVADDRAWVEVADSGPGIPAAAREAMFQRFHRRLDRCERGGSGLGLAIAHQIAVTHGGEIQLGQGADARGLVVLVGLPFAGSGLTPHRGSRVSAGE